MLVFPIPKKPWHSLPAKDVLATLDAGPGGLTSAEAARRLAAQGSNALPKKDRESAARIFFVQFKSPMVYVLLVASLISLALGDGVDAGVIAAAVALNVILGFFQENKAAGALAALQQVITHRALVLRDGRPVAVAAEELVPGDVLELSAGFEVPADARLLEAVELEVAEQALTGEAAPVHKEEATVAVEKTLAEHASMVHVGTLVTRGRGRAVVVGTGSDTEIGRIAQLLEKTEEEKTPLQQRLEDFARTLTFIVLGLCALLFIIGTLQGRPLREMFAVAVAVSVAVIPEGLLVAVTVVLALGMQRILKHGSLVRKLVAAETLGSTTVICTDKTGTLTEGQMRVVQVVTAENMHESRQDRSGSHPTEAAIVRALEIGMLCGDAGVENPDADLAEWKMHGSPTEQALLLAGMELGLRKDALEKNWPRVDEVPFESATKYMVTLHRGASGSQLLVKGALDVLLPMVCMLEHSGKAQPASPEQLAQLRQRFEDLAGRGLRTLLVGYIVPSSGLQTLEGFEVKKSTIVAVGLIGIKDPLRPHVRDIVEETKGAGIRTVMITGDHAKTAAAIAAEAGLPSGEENILDGATLARMDAAALRQRLPAVSVYARVTPEDKLRIIEAWQDRGDVVAMTGDGVNDAPALKLADIGIALGSGTDVAKEASDIVLMDNNYRTIVAAVEQGRIIFDNIKKITLYLLSNSFMEAVAIFASMAAGMPLPIAASQILWINLITDSLPYMALTLEKSEDDVMRGSPLPRRASILDRPMRLAIVGVSLITGLSSWLLFYLVWNGGSSVEHARTVAFTAMCLSSLLYVFSCRSRSQPVWRKSLSGNPILVLTVGIGLVLQLLALYWSPLQRIFGTSPLVAWEWLSVLGIALLAIAVLEGIKYYGRRKIG